MVGDGVWSVYYNKEDIETAVGKARRRRRPETRYRVEEEGE